MDSYEATRVVFTRIQTLDPENASKIMGYILLQDPGEKEMIRIAFGPETRMRSLVQEAKAYLGISSNSSSAQSTPSSPTPFKPARIFNSSNLRSPPPPPPPHPWLVSGFSTDLQSNNPVNAVTPAPPSSLSYAAVVNGTKTLNTASSLSPSSSFIYQNHNNGGNDVNSGGDLIEEYQLPDHLSFLNDSKSEELSSPNAYHRRSHSLSDVGYTEETASGLGWRPCLYYARGFCKNGSTCKFLHGGFGDSCDLSAILGSPSKLDGFEQCQDMLRSRAAQQQRLAMASQLVTGSSFPYNNKCLSFLNETQRSALMMGEEFHKFGRLRSERNDFSAMNSPGSRQIYLTFPADSTFREEDVSNYFSIYGPVQDVRIPYQQKRMFGFVTFVYPETVKLILAKGNPHFVCDSRVLVKPYKEKGKVEKKNHQQLQQQLDRCELSSCCSPHGLDSREPFDIHIGPRMFYNQEMILRRKLEEQAEMQQALEIEGRRLMNLQLLDLKNHRRFQYPQNLSSGAPVPLSAQSFPHYNESFTIQSDGINQENPQEDGSVSISSTSPNAPADQERQQELNAACKENRGGNKESSDIGDFYLDESSLEHILPDSLFASPTKSAGETRSVFGGGSTEAGEGDAVSTTSATLLPASPIVNLSSLKSCHFEMPRFSSGHGAIEM